VSIWLIVFSAARATGSSVELGGDGVRDVGQLLLLLLKIFGGGGGGVLFEPVSCFLDGFEDLFNH
jgi:hypothetical protein